MKTLSDIIPLYEYQQTPMTPQFTRIFQSLLMASDASVNSMIEDVENEFLYKILDKRLNAFGISVTPVIKLFILMLAENPAVVVMYIHALYVISEKQGPGVCLTTTDFCSRFADGFPSKAELAKAWAHQKDEHGNNILDKMTPLGVA